MNSSRAHESIAGDYFITPKWRSQVGACRDWFSAYHGKTAESKASAATVTHVSSRIELFDVKIIFMNSLPEAKWFCAFGEVSGLKPMALPIHEEGQMWYVEGDGHVDSQNRRLIGLPARSILTIMKSAQEIMAWRAVAEHLEAGGDIMDITVPHEDGSTEVDTKTSTAI